MIKKKSKNKKNMSIKNKNKKSKNKTLKIQTGKGLSIPRKTLIDYFNFVQNFDKFLITLKDDGLNISKEAKDTMKNLVDQVCNKKCIISITEVYSSFLDISRTIIPLYGDNDDILSEYNEIILYIFDSLDRYYTNTSEPIEIENVNYIKTKMPTTYLCPNQNLRECINFLKQDVMWLPDYYLMTINSMNKDIRNDNLYNRSDEIDIYMNHLYKILRIDNMHNEEPFYCEKMISELVIYWMKNKNSWIKSLDKITPGDVADYIFDDVNNIFTKHNYSINNTKILDDITIVAYIFCLDINITINQKINWTKYEKVNLT